MLRRNLCYPNAFVTFTLVAGQFKQGESELNLSFIGTKLNMYGT
jgi:hypothetical protein